MDNNTYDEEINFNDLAKEDINILVPVLLGKTNEYSKNLSDRVKINSIFNEFDAYTHENFQKFIKMSEQRYKSIKSGNHLQKKLLSQRQEYNDIAEQILNNQFYNNNDIEKESKKLLKKMNKKENNKEISELRKNIIQKTKDFTKKEIQKRNRLASAALERRRLSEIDRLAHRVTRRDLIYRPQSMQEKYRRDDNMPLIQNEEVKIKNDVDEYLKKKQFFDELMENDCKNINENISDYKDFVKDVERVQVNKDKDVVLPGSKKDNYGHSFTFLTDGIKLLSYKEEQIVNTKPKHIEEPKIDIFNLMRYTRRGNKKWFKEELKKKSAKRLSAIPSKSKALNKLRANSSKRTNRTKDVIDMKEHNQNAQKQNQNQVQIHEEQKDNNINNLNNNVNTNNANNANINTDNVNTNNEKEENEKNIDYSNFNMNKANSFTNFKNTIKTVKNEAEKAYFLNENFDKKKDSMDLLFNNKVLPNIEDYEYIIQKNMLKKGKPKMLNNEQNDFEDEENINSKENKNKELTRHHLDSFSKKKLTWTKEDFLREQSKKKDKDVLEETKKYLKEVKEVQKKANKEQSINQCISIFNKYLNEHNDLYKKKNEITHKKRIKKNVNKNLIELQNKKEEEKKKKKEEERLNYLELFEKMRENLDKEDQDEEDIKLNFQYKLYKGFVKETNLGLNAYDDYLELLQLAKERKIRGVYDQNNMVEKKEEAKKPVNRASAYDNLISNVAKLNTYIDSSGQLAQYKNPLGMLSKRRTVVGTNIMKP